MFKNGDRLNITELEWLFKPLLLQHFYVSFADIHTLRQELSCSINWIAGFSVSLAFNFVFVDARVCFAGKLFGLIVL